jgi:hypothetical protein
MRFISSIEHLIGGAVLRPDRPMLKPHQHRLILGMIIFRIAFDLRKSLLKVAVSLFLVLGWSQEIIDTTKNLSGSIMTRMQRRFVRFRWTDFGD